MAEDATTTVVKKKPTNEDAPGIESQIKDAMRTRVDHFKEQADSLTFEGVRRLIEKDLGLEQYALDVHKRFIKQFLFEFMSDKVRPNCLDGAGGVNGSKDSGEAEEKQVRSVKENLAESPEGVESNNNIKDACSENEEKMEDSPVMGLLTGVRASKPQIEETQSNQNKEVLSESSIKKALLKRASYIKANSEKITLLALRRLLEGDLKLEKYALDPYKKFIMKELDEVLKSPKASEVKKTTSKKVSHAKAPKKVHRDTSSDSLDEESDHDIEDETKPKRKPGATQKTSNSDASKKRKKPEKETKVSAKKRIKLAETRAEENNGAEDSGNTSEDSHSQLSAEKPAKKKEPSTPAYGKLVEHLKSVIKSCGMSVPPAIYKKVKQVAESKREAQLIKELEDILSKEGLSSNPSEKEIKEVRRRKERAKELEGIDMSNIVSSSRRRSTASYAPPPKPKIQVESDDDETGDDVDDDDDGNDDDDDDEDEDGDSNEDDDGDNDGDVDGQSEELDEDNDDDSE